jgi:FAD/FMN-containing dehydrogenase
MSRTVVGGEDATVGLGGLIQNGGHGLLSSHHGLASDQVYQVTVITTEGQRLVANDEQNQDLFWAVRGAGGGQYGVVTEFVLKAHPVPNNVVTGGFSFYPARDSNADEDASWSALAEMAARIPGLMDMGLTGTITALNKKKAASYLGLKHELPGVSAVISLTGFNMTIENMNSSINRLTARLNKNHLNITYQSSSTQSYWASTRPDPLSSNAAGAVSLMTSRLLGRRELSAISKEKLIIYLQEIMVSQDPNTGSMLLLGMQAGKGTAAVPEIRRGSTLPAWRQAYAHAMVYSTSIDATGDPDQSLKDGADWINSVQEVIWEKWAPQSGSYMNEGNPFSKNWKHDFYGANYDRLLGIKHKYDPSGSLFVWSGVGSDEWNYNLNSGLLCRV